MALRGTLTHRKVRRLAMTLKIDPCFALGIVEALWHVTGEQAHDGAIGRMTDEDIAMEMFYSGDPETLIAALVRAELLDTHPEHRVIIHDWHIHSDDATDNKLARAGQRYANGEPPRMRRMSEKERGKYGAHYPERRQSMRTDAHDVRTTGHEMPLPVPVPEPVPEPEPVEIQILSAAPPGERRKRTRRDSEVDPRHTQFREAFGKYFTHKNPSLTDAPWDAQEASQLSRFLKKNPTFTLDQWQRLLRNRGNSPVSHGDALSAWIGRALNWAEVPTDGFGKQPAPGGNANGNYKSKTESSIDAAREAIRRISERAVVGGDADEACYTPSIPAIPGRLRSLGSGSGLF